MQDKLLIIHMDDIGLSYAANEAAKELFLIGAATSASVMIPCAWAYEFICWSREHREYDVGIHSTLTAEWPEVKWRPVYRGRELSSMITEEGFMVSGLHGEMDAITTEDFEAEVTAQIEAALKCGLRPSHLDNHMFPFVKRMTTFQKYIEIARAYHLIPHIPAFSTYDEERRGLVREARVLQVKGDFSGYYGSREKLYQKFQEMGGGLNVLTMHPVIDTPEIRAIIPDYEERVREYEILKDARTREAIRECGLRLVSWKDIKDMDMDENMHEKQ